jgi:hypothetical protein
MYTKLCNRLKQFLQRKSRYEGLDLFDQLDIFAVDLFGRSLGAVDEQREVGPAKRSTHFTCQKKCLNLSQRKKPLHTVTHY